MNTVRNYRGFSGNIVDVRFGSEADIRSDKSPCPVFLLRFQNSQRVVGEPKRRAAMSWTTPSAINIETKLLNASSFLFPFRENTTFDCAMIAIQLFCGF